MLDITGIFSVGGGVKGAGLLMESLCQSITGTSQGSPDFLQRKQEIENTFDKINDLRDQLRTLLG